MDLILSKETPPHRSLSWAGTINTARTLLFLQLACAASTWHFDVRILTHVSVNQNRKLPPTCMSRRQLAFTFAIVRIPTL